MSSIQKPVNTSCSSRSILNTAVLSSVLLILSACGGGTETVQNPFLDGGSIDDLYTGPAARDQAVRDFQDSVWIGLVAENRCGQCHDSDGGQIAFVNELNVNDAYDAAIGYINTNDPASSDLVTKVDGGHNCWEQFASVCADSIENMIANMAGVADNTMAKVIQLTAPAIKDPGQSRNFPDTAIDNDPNSFANTVWPLLTGNCSSCHYEEGISRQQSPFFANPDSADSSYEFAKPKMNIDTPSLSSFVQRLEGGHQCWSGPANCANDAATMEAAIAQFASAIAVTTIDPSLVISKALNLVDDGIVASGGSRHEADTIALYEFKTGAGDTAFDTSGVEPPMNLTLVGNVEWLGAYGLDFTGGRAQADTFNSQKLNDFIQSTGKYSIEAWVIPANVTQEDTNIIGYAPNFSLSQTLYNYNFFNLTDADPNLQTFLSTEDAGEILQSSLQHVVVTYDTVSGRQVFVNGEKMNVTDPVPGSTSVANWQSSFAFVMGDSTNGDQTWIGKIRMAAIHSEVLTDAQVQQNFEAGVGQKYFLLFSISDQLSDPNCITTAGDHNCYIQFQVSQFDDFSYLFENPTFISLDSSWVPANGFNIQSIRIGVNGREAFNGQSFANLNATVDSGSYTASGQVLSSSGAVIALEKGSSDDEFFLTFELLDGNANPFVEAPVTPPTPAADAAAVSDIGVKTFDEINASIAQMTGIPVTDSAVDSVFQSYRQQLPTVETIDAFLSSHQMAIAQLALTYCSEVVETDAALATGSGSRIMFTDFDFTQNAPVAFDDPTEKSNAIDPVLNAVLLSSLDSQPDAAELTDLLGSGTQPTLSWDTTAFGPNSDTYNSLITEMLSCPAPGDPHYKEDPVNPGQPLFPCSFANDIDNTARTREIVKAICAAAVGSAAMLIQ